MGGTSRPAGETVYLNIYLHIIAGHTSREYAERQHGNTREVREKVTRTAGGPGEGFSYREESNFVSTSSSSTPMGSKKAVQNGHMEQHMLDGELDGKYISANSLNIIYFYQKRKVTSARPCEAGQTASWATSRASPR